jgi:hypothetical protein
MNTTIRGHNLRVTIVMALLAVLLLAAVLFAVWSAPTTSDGGNPTIHARSADGAGGSSLAQDPIHRHVKVVERLGDGSLR